MQKRENEDPEWGRKKSINTNRACIWFVLAQILVLADKGYKVAFMCYRNESCSKN